jgi:putative membrane protein
VVDQFVYLPLLVVHVLLAIVCIPLLYYVLLIALTRPVAEIRASLHPRIGRVAATLWLVSFALGTAVYLLLYVLF